jgi:replicative DNA helicase
MPYDIKGLIRIAENWAKQQKDTHYGVMIDYLGLARLSSAGNRTYSIGDFVNGLKGFVNNTGAWAVMLTQIGRQSDPQKTVNKKGEEYWTNEDGPNRDDLADSRSIEDASDNLIIGFRPEQFKMPTIKDPNSFSVLPSRGLAMFKVEKSRDYGQSQFLVRCDVAVNRFWDMDDSFDEAYWLRYKNENFWKQRM